MKIEIKKSQKPVKYGDALAYMEKRLLDISQKNSSDMIWILEHEEIYTAGTSYKENEILDKSINVVETNRGGKITYHGPGQLICYFVIDLKKRNKDIRKFISLIENTIIDTIKFYGIKTFPDKKNIGIWHQDNLNINKIAAIGVRVSKWIAYHGFSINIDNDLDKYKAIVPCGINDRGITSLKKIKDQNYEKIDDELIKNFILNLKNQVF